MRVINQFHEIVSIYPEDPLAHIEKIARTCYKTEDRITETTKFNFTRNLIARKHFPMLEHAGMTVRFITDRGVTHELVRHRLASFAQESTRFVNYQGKEIEFIRPVWVEEDILGDWVLSGNVVARKNSDSVNTSHFPTNTYWWLHACAYAESQYNWLVEQGWKPQQARTVLNNSVKTEIVVTANFVEWLHIFNLRALGITGNPHPQMQDLMVSLLKEVKEKVPVIFDHMKLETEN